LLTDRFLLSYNASLAVEVNPRTRLFLTGFNPVLREMRMTTPNPICHRRLQKGRDTLLSKANFDRPSKGEIESMAKRRFRDSAPEVVGNWWQICVYRDEYVNGGRVRKRIRVRLTASMPVREVQKIKAEYLRPLNQGFISAGWATPFEAFVESV